MLYGNWMFLSSFLPINTSIFFHSSTLLNGNGILSKLSADNQAIV